MRTSRRPGRFRGHGSIRVSIRTFLEADPAGSEIHPDDLKVHPAVHEVRPAKFEVLPAQ
jgi:hypothetical protein